MAALQLLLEYGNFFNINISQGSVATSVVFKYEFITHLHQSPTVKESGQEAIPTHLDVLWSVLVKAVSIAKTKKMAKMIEKWLGEAAS